MGSRPARCTSIIHAALFTRDQARCFHGIRRTCVDFLDDGRPIPKDQREGRSGRGVHLKGVRLVAPLDVSAAA